MAFEQTLSIIKPDATRRNLTGQIVARFEKAGLRIVAQKRIRLSTEVAEAFYPADQQEEAAEETIADVTIATTNAMPP